MELVLGNKYQVAVSHMVKSGAVVRLEDNTTELIHLSNISESYVHSADEYLRSGEAYEAECIMGRDNRLQLSLKHLKLTKRDEYKPIVQQPPRATQMYTPPVRSKSQKLTLDEMISAANRIQQDKSRDINRRNRRR